MMEREKMLGRLDALRFILNLDGEKEYVEALDDARALLEEDTPRLLIEADFHTDKADAGGAIPCWKESKSPTRRSGWAVIVYGKWLADKATARYWTGKPTEAQRKAKPWT